MHHAIERGDIPRPLTNVRIIHHRTGHIRLPRPAGRFRNGRRFPAYSLSCPAYVPWYRRPNGWLVAML